LLLSIILVVAVSAVLFGRWQLRRLAQRRVSNTIFAAAAALPPVELPAHTGPIDSGRLIVARGHFDTAGQLVLRGHVQNDGPGVQIVTAFVFDSGQATLWVLRGFAPSPDAVTPPSPIPAPELGPVTIRGLALGVPVTSDSGAPLVHNGSTSWKRLDRSTISHRRPGSLGVYLLLAGDSAGPGHLAVVAPPELSDGPHLSYAIQWFGIALAVLSFGVIVLWRGGRASTRRPEAP